MGKLNLTGQRYSRLTVIGEAEKIGYTRRWLCRCDCGNELIVRMPNLRNRHTQSCGCLQAERTSESNADDITGKRFGRLTVVNRATSTLRGRHILWNCICDCGKTTVVDGVNLRNGTTVSCGCWRADVGALLPERNKILYINGAFVPLLKSKKRTDNSTGVKGVSIRRKKDGTEVYDASIRVKGKSYWLGTHPTIEAAAAARKAGEEKYHKPYLEADHDN